MFEWYWKQPDVPHVKEFVADIRKKNGGKVPTARHWFGYVATWTCALVAKQEKTLDAVKLAKALEDFKLPPEIALMPNEAVLSRRRPPADADLVCRARGRERRQRPEDLFKVDQLVKGVDVGAFGAETGCQLRWPA